MSTDSPSAGGPSAPGRAVFLSYASEDAAAAGKICQALRAAGIEVWFDKSELRGGDAWDAAIRRQIKNCALFLPIISASTHARIEGYFRLEWKLAVDRSHLIAPDRAFLVPIAIDATPQSDERVPERFRELQWTRLPGGETPAAFVTRILRLLEGGESAFAPAAAAASPALPAPPRPRGPRLLHALIWATVLIITVPVVLYYASRWSTTHAPAPGGPAPAAAVADAGSPIPEKSIAVLPFLDMSEKHDQEYFSDGLAEELLDMLSQVPDLRVPARTSSFFFKGRSEDIAAIAQKLRVAYVLEGSVRRSGNAVRVTAQLIRADSGYHVWSKTYDRGVKDIFQVQDEIATAVVEALKAQLLPGESLSARHRTGNPEALNAYLLGNKLRENDTDESNRAALAAYQKAVALDPYYADAYSGIADAEWRISDMITGEPSGYQRALAAAERAIALAPQSSDGYWARGGLRMAYYYDWSGAAADLKKALELEPNDVRALRDYGSLKATLGDYDEAVRLYRRSLELDPLALRTWRGLGNLLLDLGRSAEVVPIVARIKELGPDSPLGATLAGMLALEQGEPQQALGEFRGASGAWKLIGTAMAEYSLGHEAASQAALAQLIKANSSTLAYQIAQIYAWRGERDAAFQWLERARRQRDGGITDLRYDRYLAGLRHDPRYAALLHEVNLPPLN